jgi:hypothetical protein
MSGVRPDMPEFHQYEVRYGRKVTLCGGAWYTTGDAPCEVLKAERDKALQSMPPCADPDDEAVIALLNWDRCWTRDGMSGEIDPADVIKVVIP